MGVVSNPRKVPPPYALLAELTHACPLHCVYCSNPLELTRREAELTTSEWLRVLEEAAALGVLQAHLSGGEPLNRNDLEDIVAEASRQGIYTQLVTSGVGLSADRLRRLSEQGLDAVQLSVQAADPIHSDVIAGRRSWEIKRRAAAAVVVEGLPLTLNVVLHRHNIDDIERIIDLALAWHADRLELANVQLYSWALLNRGLLLPSRSQTARALARFRDRRDQIGDRLSTTWVRADYHGLRPKPCMNGWARVSLTVAPDGRVLPCPVAGGIATLEFDSVRDRSLEWIWTRSPAFLAYRGEAWMPEPCRSCDRRTIDFGGCRCQAFALTGDAARTDPVCELSPDRHLINEVVAEADAAVDATTASLDSLRNARYRVAATLRQGAIR
jgi:pyrroloquinoline quinone biosynthesis protein E